MDLRIASYNIKCFPWTSPPLQAIVQWLTHHADIVALQEVWCRHSLLASAFAAHGWQMLRPPREHHIASLFGSGLVIAWRTDRFEQQDARFYPYLSAVGFDALVTKGWFRVELSDRRTNRILRFINTHMQSDYEICDELWRPIAEPVRMAQALQLSEVERRLPPLPTLLVGDMNTEMCWFPECAWMTQHCGPTFSGTSQVLDHCATWRGCEDWQLIRHRVGRECDDWSDHWPVLWTLRLCDGSSVLPRPAPCRTIKRTTIPRPPRSGPRVVVPGTIRDVPRVPSATRAASPAVVLHTAPTATASMMRPSSTAAAAATTSTTTSSMTASPMATSTGTTTTGKPFVTLSASFPPPKQSGRADNQYNNKQQQNSPFHLQVTHK